MLTQAFLNALYASATIALIAVSFSLVYSTVRFFHIAHGAIFAAGGYAAYALAEAGLPAPVAIPLAVALAALLGVAVDALVYGPLRCRAASPLTSLLCSFGVLIVIQNLIVLGFGDETLTFGARSPREGIRILGGTMTPVQLWMLAAAAGAHALLWLLLRRTRTGVKIRAVADDAELARYLGVNHGRVIRFVFGLGSALAALGAILVGYDTGLSPMMGFDLFFRGVVAAIVGGIGSITGAVYGSLLLGFLQNFGVLVVPSHWQDAIVFGVLIVFLIARPRGILGRPLERITV